MLSTATTEPGPRVRAVSSYTELAKQVRESGLLERRQGWYLNRIGIALVALAGLLVLVVRMGDSWWQLVLAGLLAVVCAQVGFLGHDAAHRQVFASAKWNEWTARLLSGVVVGLSYGWWQDKHSRHHAAPNQVDRDPDIGPGAVAFTPEIAQARTGFAGWCVRHQGWLFFPMLTLEGLSLHISSLRGPGGDPRRHRHRVLETSLIVLRFGGLVTLLLSVLPPGKAAAFLAVQIGVFGVLLGGAFAPNHTGMPIVPRTMRIDFLRRQVLMSRNVRGNALVDAAMGGLNYQIEHHLFPSMPRPHLKLVRPMVRAHCAAHGVPYTELSLVAAYGVLLRYLNTVGLRSRDPFTCPLAAQLRD